MFCYTVYYDLSQDISNIKHWVTQNASVYMGLYGLASSQSIISF